MKILRRGGGDAGMLLQRRAVANLSNVRGVSGRKSPPERTTSVDILNAVGNTISNTPGTEIPLCHPFLGLGEFPFPITGPLG